MTAAKSTAKRPSLAKMSLISVFSGSIGANPVRKLTTWERVLTGSTSMSVTTEASRQLSEGTIMAL